MPLPEPTTAEIEELTLKIAHRLTTVVQRLCGDEFETQELLAQTVAGFSLHGAQHVVAGDREGLERLCRYDLRAPFAQERLPLRADEVCHLPAAASVGSDNAAGEGEETGETPETPETTSQTPRRRAQLLRWTLYLDALKCPKCSKAMVVLALISDPPVVTRIMRHLKLPTAPLFLATPQEMWESEPYELIPPMDEHGIDERDLAGTDDDTMTLPPQTSRSYSDATRSPPL